MRSTTIRNFAMGTAAFGLLFASGGALAATASGTFNGSTWTAKNDIIGQTSDATLASGGSPVNIAPMPQYSGVVTLIMDYGADGAYICSGSLLSDRRSILTAAHCVSEGTNARPLTTTAYFYGGSNPDTVVYASPLSTAITVSNYVVNPLYTGEVIDQNDIAVLKLSDFAPSFATGYDLYGGTDLTGSTYNIAGYGQRSDVGGFIGADLGTGRLRQGDNRYDFRLGDADFGGLFTDNFFGNADVSYSYVSDFDPGTVANDASCNLAVAIDPTLEGPKYCNTGLGAYEVSTAGGDSGGPQFVDGQIASVTSYGLTFGSDLGDVDDKLDSSWGEFNGFVPVSIHKGFIETAMAVPEPSSWALMIGGIGLIGYTTRRRRAKVALAA